MRVEINSSTGFAEKFSKETWGSQPQKGRIKKLKAGCTRHASCAFFGRMRLISWCCTRLLVYKRTQKIVFRCNYS